MGEAKRRVDAVMGGHQECGSCRFFRRDELDRKSGVCRARPPTLVVTGVAKHQVTGQTVPITNSFWPQTVETEWCGAWHGRVPHLDLSALQPAEIEGTA